ncbi:MAG: GNAT family N-acetyltransferase [Clostridiales bacterium]|nr:GNAT family N-acetyltransferase [Clostridiales bacterium]
MFRKMRLGDKDEVLEIIKDIWDGTDYIGNIFDEWVNDSKGEFTCLEIDGFIVGMSKMSHIDDDVVWFEGIRVGKNYRNNGYGIKLSEYQIEKAKEKGYKKAQLATYRLNESVGIVEKLGFKRIQEFKYHEIDMADLQGVDDLNFDNMDYFNFNYAYAGFDFSFLQPNDVLMKKIINRNEIYKYLNNEIVLSNYKAKGNTLSIVDFKGNLEEIFDFIVYMGKKQKVDSITSMSQNDKWIDFLNKKGVFRLDDENRDSYLYELNLEDEDD